MNGSIRIRSWLISVVMLTMVAFTCAQSSSVFYAPLEGSTNMIRGFEVADDQLIISSVFRVPTQPGSNNFAQVPVVWSYDEELDSLFSFTDRLSDGSFPFSTGLVVHNDIVFTHHEIINDPEQRATVELLDLQGSQLSSFSYSTEEALGVWGIEVFDSTIYLASERGVGTDTSRSVLEARSVSGDLLWSTAFNDGNSQNKIRYIKDYNDTTIIIQLFERDGGAGSQNRERHFLQTIDKRTGAIVLDVDVTTYLDDNSGPAPFTFADNGDLIWFQWSSNVQSLGSHGNIVRLTFPELEVAWEAILPRDVLENSRSYDAYDITNTSSGDILVCGRVLQCPHRFGPQRGELCQYRSFATRLTPDGEVIWHRVFSVPNEFLPIDQYERYVDSYLIDIHERSDGSIITAGSAAYLNNAAFVNHPDSTDSWYMILELDGETGCLAGEECVENIVLDGQVVDTTGLIFPIGTQWTYEYRELEPLRVVNTTVTFEVVDTLDFGGRAASRVVSTLGDTIYLSEEGMNVYVYDDRIDDYVLTFDFDANNRYSDSITYFRPWEEDFVRTQVRVDSLTITFTGDDRGLETTQLIEYDVITESPFLDRDTFIFTNTIVELIGRLYGGGVVRSPFHWPDAPAGIEQLPFPSYGALRCFSTSSVEIDFLPIWPRQSCDTTYFEYNYPWSLEQVAPDRTWYVLQDELGSDRLVTRSYGLSRDTFLLGGNFYHLVLQSDVEDQAPATPTSYYLRERGGAVYRYEDGREWLVYDISHRPGDVIDIDDPSSAVDQLVCIGVDTFFNPFFSSLTMRRQLYYAAVVDGQPSADTCMTVLSGIGTLEGIEFGNPIQCGDHAEQLNCMLERSSIEYHYERLGGVDACWVLGTDTDEIISDTDGITVYPNPASDHLIITAEYQIYDVSIFSTDGQLVYRSTGPLDWQTDVDVSDLLPGLYIVTVADQDGRESVHKVVKR